MNEATHFIEVWRNAKGVITTTGVSDIIWMSEALVSTGLVKGKTLFVWKIKFKTIGGKP